MQLDRMQDIGGCRVILSNNKLVYNLRNEIIKIKNFNLKKEDNYIYTPKTTGYRGIHLIFEYCNKNEFEGLKVEVQIRSQLQHYWATGVEIIGTFTNQQLKAGIGEDNYLLFFKELSLLIADLEDNKPVNLIHAKNLKELDEELKIRKKLTEYSVITDYTSQFKKLEGRFLVTLNINEKTLNVNYFSKTKLEEATEEYIKLEEKYQQENMNIVLIEATSVRDLKKGYPNYFADSRALLKKLNFFIEKAEDKFK